MIDKLFVTKEQAEKLNQLGFNEECFSWYNYNNLTRFGQDLLLDGYAGEDNKPLAPLYQQAFNWFRKEYDYFICIIPISITVSNKTDIRYSWLIGSLSISYSKDDETPLGYLAWEEAESACLDELIKLVIHNKKEHLLSLLKKKYECIRTVR